MSSIIAPVSTFIIAKQPIVAKSMVKVQKISSVCDSITNFTAAVAPQIGGFQIIAETFSYATDTISFISFFKCFSTVKKWYQSKNKTLKSTALMISAIVRRTLGNINKLDIDFEALAHSIGNIPLLGLALSSLRIVHSAHTIWKEWTVVRGLNQEIAKNFKENPELIEALLKKRSISYNKMLAGTNKLAWGVIRLASICAGIAFFGPGVAALGKIYLTTYNCYVVFTSQKSGSKTENA